MTKKVLMYHGVLTAQTQVPEMREVGADLYDVTLENFRAQMKCIKDAGYEVKSIENCNTDKDLVITFDDGEQNNFDVALPVLREFNHQAYFFIISKRVGKQGYMGFAELQQLIKEGMKIGSHGLSHEILTNLEDSQIEQELTASKKYLEKNLECTIDTLSIPRGFCNDKILNMAYEAGYKHVFISDRLPSLKDTKSFERIAVKKSWGLKRFALAIDGKTPVKEALIAKIKNVVKLVFREEGYNKLRGVLIKVVK